MNVYRDAQGQTWGIHARDYQAALVALVPAAQNEATGRWDWGDLTVRRTVTEAELAAQYTVVPPEPRRDPRITRLGALLEQLLAEHTAIAGRPAAVEAELRAALDAVRQIPEEWSRKRTAAAQNAARSRRR